MAALSDPTDRPARPEPGLHPLAGFASADESARLVRNYRFAVERMMRILGGWIALTPELSAKLLLGRHVWDNAQHADALGKRLPELRAQAQVSEPATAAFAAFMDAVEDVSLPEHTIERLVGVYRVLKPHLLASYEDHVRRVNQVYESPTERILVRLVEDERRHIRAGMTVIAHLANTPERAERAERRRVELEALLAAAGGVTGAGLPAPARIDEGPGGALLNDDASQFIRLEQSLTHWPMPEALERALEAFGNAVVARDPDAIRAWLGVPDEGAASRLAALGAERHRVVAFAKIGQKRVVKVRFEGGPSGSVAVVARWASTPEGWRAEALDAGALDLARPA